jgi:hypothetical protein
MAPALAAWTAPSHWRTRPARTERNHMRQILSTALVAVIVGALAGVTASTIAQTPEESAITPSAVRVANADRVDGKHAVSATKKLGLRAGKLVATNKYGMLPPNIVKPYWGYIKNKPAGFADGVDNEGVTGVRVMTVTSTTPMVVANSAGIDTVDCPTGWVVVGGGHVFISGQVDAMVYDSRAKDADTWQIRVWKAETGSATVAAQAICMWAEPAGVTLAAARSDFGPAKVKQTMP